jgi:hypothetical protein
MPRPDTTCRHGRYRPTCQVCVEEARKVDQIAAMRMREAESYVIGGINRVQPTGIQHVCPSCKSSWVEARGTSSPTGFFGSMGFLRQIRVTGTAKTICINCLPVYCPHFIRWDRPKPCLDCMTELDRMYRSA